MQEPHALLHTDKPQSLPADRLWRKALSWIGNRQLNLIDSVHQLDAGLVGAGMPGDVRQRLLHDAVEAQSDIVRNLGRLSVGNESDANARVNLKLRAQRFHCRDDAHELQDRRVQLPGQSPHGFCNLHYLFRELAQFGMALPGDVVTRSYDGVTASPR